MDVNKVCKMLLGEPEKVIIEGQELEAFPLDPLEWIKVLELTPQDIPEMTPEEEAEFKETKLIPASVILRLSNATNVMLFRQKLYVLEVTLKKNDGNFDMENLNVRVAQKLTPLYDKVMELSQPPPELKKKVVSPI